MGPAEASDPEILESLWCRLDEVSGFASPSARLTALEDYILDLLPRFRSSLDPLDAEVLEEAADDAFLAAEDELAPAGMQPASTHVGAVSWLHAL